MSDNEASGAPPAEAPPSDSATDSGEDQRYFRAIEDVFIRLRGAPLLLSPADWRLAKEWRAQGIPLEIVTEALEEVFEKRRERESKEGAAKPRGMTSLRYCRRAVEQAWEDAQELGVPERKEAVEIDLPARLQALAGALPGGEAWRDLRKTILALEARDPVVLEGALGELEPQALEAAERSLTDTDRQALDSDLAVSLDRLRARLTDAEVEAAKERLRQGLLRKRTGLPVLSLFSPEVQRAVEEAG